MAGSHSSQMAKARVQKAFMYGLLAACAAAGVAVVLVGLYAKFPTHNGGPGGVWEDPNLTYVKTPNLLEIRKAFTPDLCYDSYDLQWKSGADGQIYVNGNPFFMKGKLLYMHTVQLYEFVLLMGLWGSLYPGNGHVKPTTRCTPCFVPQACHGSDAKAEGSPSRALTTHRWTRSSTGWRTTSTTSSVCPCR